VWKAISGCIILLWWGWAGPADVLAAKPASPNDVIWRSALCPVCAKSVRLARILTSDAHGGIDRDLFTRAVGPQPEFYLINTCPHCKFSGYLNDFDLILPEKTRKQLTEALADGPALNPKTPQQEIPNLLKYDLAYRTFQVLGRSDEAFGWLCLRASWVARDMYCDLPRRPEIARVLVEAGTLVPPATPQTNPADRELEQAERLEYRITTSAPAAQKRWSYDAVIAILYRRHGRNDLALVHIERVLDDRTSPKDLRDVLALMKQSIDDERNWQIQAADHFDRAVREKKITTQTLPIARYLLGQLCLRLDRPMDARRWFDQAANDPVLPPHLKQWARQAREQAR